MTKRELANRISEETGLTQQQVHLIIQKTMDAIVESLIKGHTVEFRDFGVFEVEEALNNAEFVLRNPERLWLDANVEIRHRFQSMLFREKHALKG